MREVDASPLSWPAGWPRRQRPEPSRFDTSLARARDGLVYELELLGARDIIISSNAKLLRSGEIAARQGRIDDVGIAAYFTLDGEQRCIPIDKWDRIEDNLQAARLTVAAMRGLARWGAPELVSAAFQGFQALPSGERAAWWRVLEISPDASEVEIEQAYRAKLKTAHPDVGGTAEQFYRVRQAYEQAKQRFGGERDQRHA